MDKLNIDVDTLKEVLEYFLGDDLASDIIQEIVDADLSSNSASEIIDYLEGLGYECA